jgi:hypothetical protein
MMKIRVADGIERETLAIGDRLMIVEFSFRKGADVPWHSHVHEQSNSNEAKRSLKRHVPVQRSWSEPASDSFER